MFYSINNISLNHKKNNIQINNNLSLKSLCRVMTKINDKTCNVCDKCFEIKYNNYYCICCSNKFGCTKKIFIQKLPRCPHCQSFIK